MSNKLKCPGCGLPTDEPRSEEFPRYHEYCLKEHYLPWRCDGCGEPIRNNSTHMKILGSYYHASCMTKPAQPERRPDLCAGCREVVNPGEGVGHNAWIYHRRCLDRHLSAMIAGQQKAIDKIDAELGELRKEPGWPDVMGTAPTPAERPSDVADEMVLRAAAQRAEAAENKLRFEENCERAEAQRPDDGADGQHYDLTITIGDGTEAAIQCVEVVEALGLDHGIGEAFCAIWRMGKKPGEARARALRKAIYYLKRALDKEADES